MHHLPTYHPKQIARTHQPEAITRYVDAETGEIIEVRRMPQIMSPEQPAMVCNCPCRMSRRRSSLGKWRKQLIEHVGLVGVLGLVLVVMLEMGR